MKRVKFGVSMAFWSCSVDIPYYGDPLAEIGHIWGFWALSGEPVGVNVEGGAEAYFRCFASSSVYFKLIKVTKFATKVGLEMLININSGVFHNPQKKIWRFFFFILQLRTRKITISAPTSVNFHGSF